MQVESGNAKEGLGATVTNFKDVFEGGNAHGTYHAVNRGAKPEFYEQYNEIYLEAMKMLDEGRGDEAEKMLDAAAYMTEEKWRDSAPNIVTTLGKNVALDAFLAGAAYTVVGPFLGLCNAAAATAVIGDTMSSHATWLEVGSANAPTYTAPRKTVAWSAAASGNKASSGTMTFNITSNGTVGGAFLVYFTSAANTIDTTTGTLYSAGAFSGGNKVVVTSDSLTVTYTAGL